MSSRLRWFVALALGLAPATLACGETQEPPGPIPDELAGTWEARGSCLPRCSFTLQSTANPRDSLNLLLFGARLELTVSRAGAFKLLFDLERDTTLVGTARVEAGNLIVRDAAGVTDTVGYSIEADLLRLQFRKEMRIVDFNGDGTPDPTLARASLLRRSP